jgi:geranylgeranyl reductase family protein
MRCDVAVVGAGPAGATAARFLADRGVRVALIERCRLPREKTCGGGLVARARRALLTDVGPVIERECHRVEVRLPGSTQHIVCERATPIVSMTSRARLDLLLAERARDAGALLLAPRTVTGIASGPRGIAIETDRGRIHCTIVVAADGATGTVSRAAFGTVRHAAPALEVELRPSDRMLARIDDRARFDFGVVSHGYGWVFPKGDHLSVGVVSTRRGAARLGRALEEYLRLLGLRTDAARPRGSVIPIRPAGAPWVRDRVLAVGDAAGLVDPLTAEGISAAVLSARIAASAIAKADLNPDRIERLYGYRLTRTILRGLSLSRLIARLVYSPPDWQRTVYSTAGSALAELALDLATGSAPWRTVLRAARRQLLLSNEHREVQLAGVP